METCKVVGVTKLNDKSEDIQQVLKHITDSYKANGKLESWERYSEEEILKEGQDAPEFESQVLKGVIHLKKEPDNPYDPNAIKVFLKDASNVNHHVGYIPKEHALEISQLIKKTVRIDGEFTGGRNRIIEIDGDDNEYIEEETMTTGLVLHFIDVVKFTENNPFIKAGDGSKKTKVANRIGCLLMIFIVIMFILIIF